MTYRKDWFTTPLALYYIIVMANIIVFTRTRTFNLQPSHSKTVTHFYLNSDMMKKKPYILENMYILMKCHVEKKLKHFGDSFLL